MTAPAPVEIAHFNHAGTSIPPPAVVEQVVAHLELEARVGGYEAGEMADAAHEAVFDALATLLGAGRDEVVPVESATRACELLLWSTALSRAWGRGDRVVVDRFAYASTWATLLRLQAVTGVEVAVAASGEDGAVDPARVVDVVDDRTRLVLVTHVPTHVGTVSDVGAVGAALAGRDVVYAVDVSQSLGQLPIDVARIGCQAAFAPGRKFLRAPRGTGVLFVSKALAETLVPLSADSTSASIEVSSFDLAAGARRFDPFEHSLALRLGLGEAARHAVSHGLERIADEVRARSDAVAGVVESTDGLALVVPRPLSGIVSCTHAQLDPDTVKDRLRAVGVNCWVSSVGGSPLDQADRLPMPSVRLSPHYTTTDRDLEALARALALLNDAR